MQHLVSAKAVVGSGESTVLLEIQGRCVRIKRRGQPEVLVPLESAGEIGRFLLAAAKA